MTLRNRSALILVGLCGVAFAQNPNSAVFPGAVATDQNLLVANNNATTTLTAAINATTTTVPLAASIGNLPAAITIDSEILDCTSAAGLNYTCSRAFNGSTAASHAFRAIVRGNFIAFHLNQADAEIKAIEGALGINLANAGGVNVVIFGADRTGTSDSTTAFTNAVSYASSLHDCVFVPPGQYKITGSIASPALGQMCIHGAANAVPYTGVLSGTPPRGSSLIQQQNNADTISLTGLSNVIDGLDFTIASGVTGVTAIYGIDTSTQPFSHNRLTNNTIHGYSTGATQGTYLAVGIDIESIGANSNNNLITGNRVELATVGYKLNGASSSEVVNANQFFGNAASNNTTAAVLTNASEMHPFQLEMEGNGTGIVGTSVCCTVFMVDQGEQSAPRLTLDSTSHDNTYFSPERSGANGDFVNNGGSSSPNSMIDLSGIWQGINSSLQRWFCFACVGSSANRTPNLAILQVQTDSSGTRPVFRAGASNNPDSIDDISLGPLGTDGISPAPYYFASHAAASTMPGSTPMALFDQYNTTGQGNNGGGCVAIAQGSGNTIMSQDCGYYFNSSGTAVSVHAFGVLNGSGTLIFPANVNGYGGMTLNGAIPQPTCNASTGGTFFYVGHTTGVKDTVQVCAADSTNTYAWRSIY